MTYIQAVFMEQEMTAALQYKDIFPNEAVEVAKKYTGSQWFECADALLANLQERKKTVLDFLQLVKTARNLPEGG